MASKLARRHHRRFNCFDIIGETSIDWRGERVPVKTLGFEKGWVVRSRIDWREERNILYKGLETSQKCVLKLWD